MSKESALAQIGAVEMPVSRSKIVATIEELFASYPAKSEADVERRAALFSDDVVFEDPVGAPTVDGRSALTQFFHDALAAGWVIHMSSQRIVVCGAEAISLTKASWGIGNDEPANVDVVHAFAFDTEGRIRRLRVFFDETTVS